MEFVLVVGAANILVLDIQLLDVVALVVIEQLQLLDFGLKFVAPLLLLFEQLFQAVLFLLQDLLVLIKLHNLLLDVLLVLLLVALQLLRQLVNLNVDLV